MNEVNFQSLLKQIDYYCGLKKMAEDTGISYKHLNNLKNGNRLDPKYSIGSKIVVYYEETMKNSNQALEERFERIKKKMINGWQIKSQDVHLMSFFNKTLIL